MGFGWWVDGLNENKYNSSQSSLVEAVAGLSLAIEKSRLIHIVMFILSPLYVSFEYTHQIKGRLQSEYKFFLKAAFLYADIPAKTNFSEKFMF